MTTAANKKRVKRKSPKAPPSTWNPNIVVFACNWCSYAGADTAGVSRIQHQPHFRMIRVMCSGRIQPSFVLHAFEKGADGVLVSGCHPGDCHYLTGNFYARRRFQLIHDILDQIGMEPDRVRFSWVSAAEGVKFASLISDYTARIKDLGPSKKLVKDIIPWHSLVKEKTDQKHNHD